MHKERLLTLARHLQNNRGYKLFDFGFIWREDSCGTAGCALGELQFCFPDNFGRKETEDAACSGSRKCLGFFDKVYEFFDVNEDEANHLFESGEQNVEDFGGKELSRFATAREVANNIRDFVNHE